MARTFYWERNLLPSCTVAVFFFQKSVSKTDAVILRNFNQARIFGQGEEGERAQGEVALLTGDF